MNPQYVNVMRIVCKKCNRTWIGTYPVQSDPHILECPHCHAQNSVIAETIGKTFGGDAR